MEANNLEAFFYHQDSNAWDLSGVMHPPESKAAPSATENRSLKLTVNNLTLFFRTHKREVKQFYTKMVIRPSPNDGEGYFELRGDRDERLNPVQFYPDLPGLKVKGNLRGKFHFFMDMEDPQTLRHVFDGKYEPIKVLSLGTKINIQALASPFQHTVRRLDRKRVSFIVGEKNPDYIPLSRMPESVVAAVITAEDGGFFKHKGFNTLPIRDSFVENLKAGRVVRGASTITMQLAKNLYLRPERTFSRKFEESFITMAIEQTLSKERIMEIYLNSIEWGDGIYGIGPAAQYYYKKSPTELTPVESAFLASIIPYPRKKWGPDPLSNISEGWWQYLRLILCRMYERGGAEVDDLRQAGVEESRIARLTRN